MTAKMQTSRRRKRNLLTILALPIVVTALWPSIFLMVFSEYHSLLTEFNSNENHTNNDATRDSRSVGVVPGVPGRVPDINVPIIEDGTSDSSNMEVMQEVPGRLPDGSSVPVVAYIVTVTECIHSKDSTSTWKQNSVLHNAAAVFQRAIQLASFPLNPKARYGHQLYVIMYAKENNQKCADEFRKLGYTVLLRDLPVPNPLGHLIRSYPIMEKKFPGKFLPRPLIQDDGCCGERELLKLRLYELVQHPVVVHLDLDSLVLQPLDELFDVITMPAHSPEGAAARQHLMDAKLIAPTYNRSLPSQIDAFYTKDWCSSKPKFNKLVGIQGGFLVARPSLDVYKDYQRIIQEGNYTLGRGAGSGWGSSGYGRHIVGSMTFQGITPYYYDLVNRTGVELHRCKFNQMVDNPRETINARFPRPTPLDPEAAGFRDGECRDGRKNCDDVQCQNWPLEDARSVHFTSCLKPWDCPDPAIWNNTLAEGNCRRLHREWYRIRQDVGGQDGKTSKNTFEPEMFLGFCKKSGGEGYIPIAFKQTRKGR